MRVRFGQGHFICMNYKTSNFIESAGRYKFYLRVVKKNLTNDLLPQCNVVFIIIRKKTYLKIPSQLLSFDR